MKFKKKEEKILNSLCWNVYIENVNLRKIEPYNVFRHSTIQEGIVKAVRNFTNRDKFADDIRHVVMYQYWGRCEYEVIIGGWPSSKDGKEEIKVDVYEQIKLNFDIFIDYLMKAFNLSEDKQKEENKNTKN